MTLRHRRFRAEMLLLLAGLLVCTSVLLQEHQPAPLRGSTSETVCLSLIVYGPDGGSTGSGSCLPDAGGGGTSSSSASSTGGGGTTGGGTGSNEADDTGTATDPLTGGRRHSIPQDRSRMLRLIRNWTRRHAAAPTPTGRRLFPDVPDNAWYIHDLRDLVRRGFVKRTGLFRPDAGATRAEAAELFVAMFGGVRVIPPRHISFEDTPRTDAFFAIIEEAASRKWLLGYGNCLGTHPCIVRPHQVITRAEAANIIVRVFSLQRTGDAPRFPDNPTGPWYTRIIQIAADHCVLQGDARTGLVRPDDLVTRAELVVMARRGFLGLSYGTDCTYTGATPNALPAHPAAPTDSGAGGSFLKPAPLPVDADPCLAPDLSCIASAVIEDTRTIIYSVFGGMLAFPDAGTIAETHLSESTVWLLGSIWIALMARILYIFFFKHLNYSASGSRFNSFDSKRYFSYNGYEQ